MRTYTGSISRFTGLMALAQLGITSLTLSHSALATDYYASEQWIIQQDFQIDAGDRVIVNQDTHVYLADNATLTINPNAALILQEGVNIDVGENTKIAVYGELNSMGNAYNMNRFQSVQLSPTNSDWQGITTYNGSTVNLRYTQISHAVNAIHAQIGTTILFPTDSNQNYSDTHYKSEIENAPISQLNIRYSDFSHNQTAINVSELHTFGQLDSSIQYNQFSDNQYHLYTSSQAQTLNTPISPTVIDARFNWWSTTDINHIKQHIRDTQNTIRLNNQNSNALRVNYSHFRQSIYNNDILTNAFMLKLPKKWKLDDPITIDPGFNRESHYQLDGNFLIAGDTQFTPYQLATLTENSMLIVSENSVLSIAQTARFIVEPGAVIYLSKNSQINVNGHWELLEGVQVIAEKGARINLNGSLYAQGASHNRVNFNAASHLINPNWQGIQLSQGAELNLRFAQVQHAQQGIYANLVPDIVFPEQSLPTNSSQLEDEQTKIIITHTRFIENGQAIRLDVVPETQNVDTLIEYNDFIDNNIHLFTQVYPFHAYKEEAQHQSQASLPFSPIIINAKLNWWNSNQIAEISDKIIDFQRATNEIDGLRIDYSQYRHSPELNDIVRNSLVVELPDYLKVSDPFQIDPGYNLETEYKLDGDFIIAGDTQIKRYQVVTLTSGSNLHISDNMSLSLSPNAIFIIEPNASITFGHNSQLLSQGLVIDRNH
ncbi:hypothetical protein [uncultured Shewanella sp.]|uniref:hypothetical protein n=1 Tax=uncultured Shewanella sp. TaxID=173975 RepID=UPI002611CE11|nr:hypothetical protein [uncultured Shewanella sp.]